MVIWKTFGGRRKFEQQWQEFAKQRTQSVNKSPGEIRNVMSEQERWYWDDWSAIDNWDEELALITEGATLQAINDLLTKWVAQRKTRIAQPPPTSRSRVWSPLPIREPQASLEPGEITKPFLVLRRMTNDLATLFSQRCVDHEVVDVAEIFDHHARRITPDSAQLIEMSRDRTLYSHQKIVLFVGVCKYRFTQSRQHA
jgi:hypothetical protein